MCQLCSCFPLVLPCADRALHRSHPDVTQLRFDGLGVVPQGDCDLRGFGRDVIMPSCHQRVRCHGALTGAGAACLWLATITHVPRGHPRGQQSESLCLSALTKVLCFCVGMKQYVYICIYLYIYIAEDQTLHLRAQAGSFSPLRSNWVPAVMRSDVCANGHGDSGNFDTGTYYYLFKSAFLRHPAVIFEAMLSGQIRWTKSPI